MESFLQHAKQEIRREQRQKERLEAIDNATTKFCNMIEKLLEKQ